MASSADVMKPDRFNGTNFRHCQSRAKLWLTDLRVFWVVTASRPLPVEPVDIVQKWEDANTSALGSLLAVLSDTLFDSYRNFESARELWEELESKYSATDYGNESFVVEKYMKCTIEESHVVEKVHEIQLLVKDLGQYDTHFPEKFQVNMILAKLPARIV